MSTIFGLSVEYRDVSSEIVRNDLRELVERKSKCEISPEGMTSFLTYRYPIGKYTMFEGIERIPFGYDIVDSTLRQAWYPKYSTIDCSLEDSKQTIDVLLKTSIERLTKGKKIGIVLSGGLDSSLVVALAREIYPSADLRTYTSGFVGDNEFEYARIVSEKFETEHKEIELSVDDYLGDMSFIRELIRFKGEPLHPNELALAYAEKQAALDGCEVILCGEGADDIFGGYGRNFRMYMNFPGGSIRDFVEFFLNNYRYFSLKERKSFINSEYLVDDIALTLSQLDLEDYPVNLEDNAIYITQKLHTPGLITRGKNAIAFNNMEAGFPFIDDELVAFVNSLPFEFKIKWKDNESETQAKKLSFKSISEVYDVPKYILKKVSEKYLPDEIIYRKKYGFPVPFDLWMKDIDSWDLRKDFFTTNNISELNGWKKFMLINLNTFLEEFV